MTSCQNYNIQIQIPNLSLLTRPNITHHPNTPQFVPISGPLLASLSVWTLPCALYMLFCITQVSTHSVFPQLRLHATPSLWSCVHTAPLLKVEISTQYLNKKPNWQPAKHGRTALLADSSPEQHRESWSCAGCGDPLSLRVGKLPAAGMWRH